MKPAAVVVFMIGVLVEIVEEGGKWEAPPAPAAAAAVAVTPLFMIEAALVGETVDKGMKKGSIATFSILFIFIFRFRFRLLPIGALTADADKAEEPLLEEVEEADIDEDDDEEIEEAVVEAAVAAAAEEEGAGALLALCWALMLAAKE